jgi:hypothetical protein
MIPKKYEEFLLEQARAGEVSHSGRTLYEHLAGTYELLREWGNVEPVCLAGLFHSIYGTQHFKRRVWPLTDRATIQELIGPQAELMAFIFCTCDRALFLGRRPRALREIEAANLIEQGSRGNTLKRLSRCDISPEAKRAIERHLAAPGRKEKAA